MVEKNKPTSGEKMRKKIKYELLQQRSLKRYDVKKKREREKITVLTHLKIMPSGQNNLN